MKVWEKVEFNSYIFTLALLPCVILIYYGVQKFKAPWIGKVILILFSFYFILYAGTKNLVFLVLSMIVNYLLSFFIKEKGETIILSKLAVSFSLIFNIGFLGYTKYTYFIIENLDKRLGIHWEIEDIFIPLGISFVTFQQIAYVIDVYRKKVANCSLLDYILYIVYFPKYIQGPIARYSDFEQEINKSRKFDTDSFAYGIWLFVTGLGKKVLIADIFSKAVSWGIGYSIDHMTAMDAIFVVLSFTFQIYFDFSGYSSMAIGISKMFNISLPDNFDSPYQSYSVIEFWKKWHISLTSFLRAYLYIPLGGNKKGKIRYYLNMFFVFCISGIWHGAAWTYIVWGGLQGAAYCLNKLFYKQWMKINQILQWILTFIFINISWLFFRALSVSQALDILKKIFRMENTSISDGLINCFKIPEITFLSNRYEGIATFVTEHRGIEMWLFLMAAMVLSLSMKDKCSEKFKPSLGKCIITILVFSWSVISFSTVVEYIYGGF